MLKITMGDKSITLPCHLGAGQIITISNHGENPLYLPDHPYKEYDLKAMGYVKYKKPWWKLW